MELQLLIPLLASLQTLFPPAAPSAPPAPPTLSVTPPRRLFHVGDSVSLLCSAPGSEGRVQGFRFSGAGGWNVDVRTSRRSFALAFNVSGSRDGGDHTCSYTLLRPGAGPAHSPDSQPLLLHVKAPPPAPSLSPTPPGGVTVAGQPFGLFCSAPSGPARRRRFRFFRDGREAPGGIPGMREIPGEEGAELRVEESGRSHGGNFSCRYEEEEEEEEEEEGGGGRRWIPSENSPEVAVTVRDPAPPPSLWAEPPSGRVGEGQRLLLSCSSPRREFGIRFRFFRDGAELPAAAAGGNSSSSSSSSSSSELLLPEARPENSGNFSCRAEEEVGGAWVTSPPSRVLRVTVRARPSQPALLLATPPGHAQALLTCVAPDGPAHLDHAHPGHAQRRFYFFCGGAQRLVDTTAGSQSQLSVNLATPPSGDAEATPPFTCQYEEWVGEGWVLSPPSAPLTLAPPPAPAQSGFLPLVVGCAVGGAVMLLGLPLALWMCRRRRGGSRWRGLSPGDDTGTLPMGEVA